MIEIGHRHLFSLFYMEIDWKYFNLNIISYSKDDVMGFRSLFSVYISDCYIGGFLFFKEFTLWTKKNMVIRNPIKKNEVFFNIDDYEDAKKSKYLWF